MWDGISDRDIQLAAILVRDFLIFSGLENVTEKHSFGKDLVLRLTVNLMYRAGFRKLRFIGAYKARFTRQAF